MYNVLEGNDSYIYPSKHNPVLMITSQNNWCFMSSDLGYNATGSANVAYSMNASC